MLLPRYTHIVDRRLKYASLRLDAKGEIVVKSPGATTREIESLLLKHTGWIKRARKQFEAKKGKQCDIIGREQIYLLGEIYPVEFFPNKHSEKPNVVFQDNRLILYTPDASETAIYDLVDAFYKQEAKHYLPAVLKQWSDTMQLYPERVTFRKTTRQWGSCSSQNNLSLNTMMMKLPKHLIDYILVHELTHIRHKHHQKTFWEGVAAYLPDYKRAVAELKHYTP